MKRYLWVGGVAAVVGMGAMTHRAQAKAPAAKHQVVSRLSKALPKVKGVGGQASVSATRKRIVFGMAFDVVTLMDNDDDGEATVGDMALASGDLVDNRGKVVGTWDGTLAFTSEPGTMFNITCRFYRTGTATIVGAPYGDGISTRAAYANLVGITGDTGRLYGPVALGYDSDNDLLVAEFVYR
jgi:hypothetical protein